jgi:CheY-like chemotaxis protein
MLHKSSSPRILFIDDYQNCCDLISRLLWVEKCDYNFSIANTPKEALELIVSNPFDLYILENKLPEMKGVELCRWIRKTDKGTPILFFIKNAKPFDRESSFAAGENEFLIKADDSQRISGIIRKMLNESFMKEVKNNHAVLAK